VCLRAYLFMYVPCRMRSRDLPKLRSFIQEWVDEYYNTRKNKVKLGLDWKSKTCIVTCLLQLIIYKCNFYNHGWDDDNQWKEHGYRKVRSFNSVVLKKGEQDRILNGKLRESFISISCTCC